jgi:hypothetical protein
MKLLGDVKSEEDFFQYPVKQKLSYPDETKVGVVGYDCNVDATLPARYTVYELKDLMARGNGDYERTKANKLLANERQTNKNMFWDKLVHAVSTQEPPPTTNRQIWLSVAKYYMDQGKTPPWVSLDDKVLHYKVQCGLMSLENAYLQYHPTTRSDGRRVRLVVKDEN